MLFPDPGPDRIETGQCSLDVPRPGKKYGERHCGNGKGPCTGGNVNYLQ